MRRGSPPSGRTVSSAEAHLALIAGQIQAGESVLVISARVSPRDPETDQLHLDWDSASAAAHHDLGPLLLAAKNWFESNLPRESDV